MSGPCPALADTHADVARLCQVHDWPDLVDYLHSSPAALAVALTALLGFIAFMARPALERLYTAWNDRRRRRRLLTAFSLEIAHSRLNLEKVYSDVERERWSRLFDAAADQGSALIPFQTYSDSDFMSSAMRAELPFFKPVIAELIVRYYANDSLLSAGVKDLRSEAYRDLSGPRKKAFYNALFDLANQQIETCDALSAAIGRPTNTLRHGDV